MELGTIVFPYKKEDQVKHLVLFVLSSTTTTFVKRNVVACFREMKHMNTKEPENEIEQTFLPEELPE